MKILFLTFANFSCVPTYKRAVGTGEALAERGHDVYIVAFDSEENRIRLQYEAPNCHAIFISARSLLAEMLRKIVVVWRVNPDVMYSNSFTPRNLAFCRFLLPWRMKTVLEFSELYSAYPWCRRNWAFWERYGCFENDYILCASRFLEKHFKRYARHILYSPYAYPDYLIPIRPFICDIKTVVFMAAMHRGYGVFEVLKAFELFVHKRPGVELEMIGGGPDKDEVQKWVADHGLQTVVHVRGYVPEDKLIDYFSKAAFFVSPMHDTIQDWARCPSKLFYYLPYNKPIVTCKIGNPADVLGDFGFYYTANDCQSMTDAFIRAFDANSSFTYPSGFVEAHSWHARALELEEWLQCRKGK